MTRSKSRHSGGLVGSLLVIVGALAVLGVTFGVGVATGRRWLRLDALTRWTRSEAPGDPAGARPARRPARSPQSAAPASRPENLPSLTFYKELTAPLAPPTPSSRADSARSPKSAKPESNSRGTRPKPDRTPGGGGVDGRALPPPGVADAEPAFTVQVVAYRARSQADAFRATLAARGLDADVSEVTTPDGPRYRVRVGNYQTKAAAQDAASRLAADTRLGVFVATR